VFRNDPRATYALLVARFKLRTTVERWDDAEGWGALATSEETPGGVFVHFTAIRMAGFRTLRPGQEVEAVVYDREQDGYRYVATVVRSVA
jgi:CspA family cold shock protein